MEQAAPIPVRTLFSETIEVLGSLIKQSRPKQREALQQAMATLREMLPRAEEARSGFPKADVATTIHLAAGIVEPESPEKAVTKAWGADLERRRKAAGLTRPVLAQRAGISESTLRDVETGRRTPTRKTIMHLQSVPELRIDPHQPVDEIGSSPIRPRCSLRIAESR